MSLALLANYPGYSQVSPVCQVSLNLHKRHTDYATALMTLHTHTCAYTACAREIITKHEEREITNIAKCAE